MAAAPNPILQRLAGGLDKLSQRTGEAVSWLTLFMVIVTCIVVILRYVFDLGWIWLQESVTWMHATVFMVGAAYTLQREDHVRVDILYRGMSARKQAWVNLLGTVFLLLPTTLLILFSSLVYVSSSWQYQEVSQEAGGLPALYLLKAVMPLGAALLSLQGFALGLRSLLVLLGLPADSPSARASGGEL
ncbi:MAG: TRAP transporter small permease subunit [Gammaproteobacteria bacterium]|jgi:TRAP-type mannitol/chloroaromatic compound transport system permease small subunit|nr:TRAP transporter small permease subunit [Gammaproteobacteria bacterium]